MSKRSATFFAASTLLVTFAMFVSVVDTVNGQQTDPGECIKACLQQGGIRWDMFNPDGGVFSEKGQARIQRCYTQCGYTPGVSDQECVHYSQCKTRCLSATSEIFQECDTSRKRCVDRGLTIKKEELDSCKGKPLPMITLPAAAPPPPPPPPPVQCSATKTLKDGKCVEKKTEKKNEKKTKKKEKKLICAESEHLERDKGGKKCKCAQLYSMSTRLKQCLFAGATGLKLTGDARDALEEAIEKLKADESGTVKLKFRDGKTIILGILRLPNGQYLFTPDGEHYEDSPADALAPGFLKRAGTSFGDLTKGFKRFFGVGKYTGKGTKGDLEAQEEGQLITDAATAALENLQGDANIDKKLESAQEILERWTGRTENILGKQWQDAFLDEMKNATGVDIPLLKKIFTGDIAGIGTNILQKVYTFPAEAVIILGGELKNANFANAARIYAQERKAGKKPSDIMQLLQAGQLPELDFVSSITGVGQRFGQGTLLLSYEEAYQRFLLGKKLKVLNK